MSSNDPSPWLEIFFNKLAPLSSPYLDDLPSPYFPLSSSEKLDQPFSLLELQSVLDHVKDSSPGADGIPYSFLVKAGKETKNLYLKLVNKFFETGIIPDSWKLQLIIPILKPNKDPSDPNSYRPIALSSVLLKITEHLIKNRLEWFVESKGILAESQFGFRKDMSTIDSLSIFTTDVWLTLSENKTLVGVFLDISSAYDNVLLPLLRQKMLQLSIPVRLVHFICNILLARSVQIRFQGSILPPRNTWRGLPQGSVLSPLLYSIYTYDLERSVNSFCNILQYADDIAMYVSSDSVDDASVRLNRALHYLADWLSNHGLDLSVPKSSVVIFSRKRTVPSVNISFEGKTISVQSKIKFLGVTLDSKMTGRFHLDYVVNKCEKNINILRSLSGVWWGSHPYTQKLVYNATIRSVIDYGSFLLEPCNKLSLSKLDKLRYKCLRIICGAMKSSPTNALQSECCDPPLNIRRQFLCDRFVLKIIQNSSHPLISKLQKLLSLINSQRFWLNRDLPCLVKSYRKYSELPYPTYQCSRLPLYSVDYDTLIFQPEILLNFGINKDNFQANSIFNQKLLSDWKDWLTIFTDASKMSKDGCTGAAVWVPNYNVLLNFKCPPLSSIFTGEAVALLEAIKFIECHNFEKTIIFTDSLSCLQSILCNQLYLKLRSPLILKIKELLLNCHNRGLKIVLAWIPSHTGITGNEIADSFAKDSIQTGTLEHYYVLSQDLLSWAKVLLNKAWNNAWSRSLRQKGRHYGDIQPEISVRPWFSRFRNIDKQTSSTICRLRLGHTCSPEHLFKIGVRDSPMCDCGQEEGSLDHIFFNCPLLVSSLYDILPSNIPKPINLKSLLTRVHSSFVKSLAKFIHTNNIRL